MRRLTMFYSLSGIRQNVLKGKIALYFDAQHAASHFVSFISILLAPPKQQQATKLQRPSKKSRFSSGSSSTAAVLNNSQVESG